MPSLLPGFEYDIFISYRHNDNRSGWVTEFVRALQEELASTIKDPVSIYFDTNPHDGLSDHHDVDLSLREKVKSLIFIPIISQTFCDPRSFAWKHEFLPFRELASNDEFGLKLKVANGNVASRIIPVRIHELDNQDLSLLEKELGGILRAIDFTFRATGINRPLTREDRQNENLNKTLYENQINKIALAIKEILDSVRSGNSNQNRVAFRTERFSGFNEIPIPATTLFGRDKELKEIIELIKNNRVVSIIGSGGMGKTRLALELSHRQKNEFSGNVVFVPLASITTAEDVLPSLANALGIKEAEGRNLTKGISTVIGDTKALLVLDNLEQVIAVAPQIAEIISASPNLKILSTSRTPLKIRGEHEYPLKPLSLPSGQKAGSIDQLLEFPSISLFIDRARKVSASFSLTNENADDVIQICRRLDGLPLALELAAARMRMVSIKQLLQRLEHALDILTGGSKDLPERHQTLRATIDWSYSLLTEPEKRLFRRMAVFSGGCTQSAMEKTCYDENSGTAFDELESLVDKGLVQHVGSSDRFLMLQTIKEYAIEKLESYSETQKIKFRQAKYFQGVAALIRQGLERGDQLTSMQLGILEEENIQSALDFLLNEDAGTEEGVEIGLTICGELWFYWHIRCKHIMARHYSNAFLAKPNCPVVSRGKCLCLLAAGLASSTLGKHEQSVKEHQASYDMAVMFKDRSIMAFNMLSLFIAYLGLGKIEDANACVQRCVQYSHETGNDFEIAFGLCASGIMHTVKGELEEARKSYELALDIQTRIPDLEGGGLSRGGLALISSILGNYDESIELYRASLNSFATIGDRAEEARILEEMAWVFLKIKNSWEARKYFMDSILAYEDVGSVRGIGIALLGIAGVESAENHPGKAIEIATAAQLFTEQEGIVNNYGEGFQGKVYIDSAKNKLSKEELDKAVARGKKLLLKDTLRLANGS